MTKPLLFVIAEPEVYQVLAAQPEWDVHTEPFASLGRFMYAMRHSEVPVNYSPAIVVFSDTAPHGDVAFEAFAGRMGLAGVLIAWNPPAHPLPDGLVVVQPPLTPNALRAAIGRRLNTDAIPPLPNGDHQLYVVGHQEPAPLAGSASGNGAEPNPGPPSAQLPSLGHIVEPLPGGLPPETPAPPARPRSQPQPPPPHEPSAPPQPGTPPAPELRRPTQPATGATASLPAPSAPHHPAFSQPPGPPAATSGAVQAYTPPQPPAQAPPTASPQPRPSADVAMPDTTGAHPAPVLAAHSAAAQSNTVIAVWSGKGGVGKTSIAINLAARIAARTDLATCIVDLDIAKGGDISVCVNSWRPTVLELIREPHLTPQSLDMLYREPTVGFDAVFAPVTPDQAADTTLLSVAAYDRILRVLKARYDIIIFDCATAVTDRLNNAFAFPRSDVVLSVVNNHKSTMFDVARGLDSMLAAAGSRSGIGIRAEQVAVVMNGMLDGVDITDRDIRKVLQANYPVVARFEHDARFWTHAGNLGRFASLIGPPEIQRGFDDIITAIVPGVDLDPVPDPAGSRSGRSGRARQGDRTVGAVLKRLLGR